MGAGVGAEDEPHGEHGGIKKTMAFVEALGLGVHPVRKQGDPFEIFFTRVIQRIVEKAASQSVAPELSLDDEILEQNNRTSFGRRNRKQQVNHSKNQAVLPEDEDSAPAGLLQKHAKSPGLPDGVWVEVPFQGKQIREELRQLREIL